MYEGTTNYKISNIVNYLRKSRRDEERERRTGEDTLEEQKKLMQRVLNDMGIPYTQKFEIGSGDKISSRPVFQEVLEELKMGKYDAIAVKEISRLGRGSYTDMGVIYDLLVDRRIYIITPYKIYDPRNNSDIRQIRFELFFAREEFETIRERLTGARYSAAMEGKWMGKVPFGYRRNGKTMKLEPVEEEAKTIRLIFDLYVNGIEGKEVGTRAISTFLKRLGIKSPKGKTYWDTTQIRRILSNEAYIGIAKYRTTERKASGEVVSRPENEHIIVQNAHETIINENIFYKAQKKLQSRKQLTKTKFDLTNYELTGLMVCKRCGKKLVINRYKRKRKSGSDYYDQYIKCKQGCFTTKYDHVEKNVIRFLSYLKDLDRKKLEQKIKELIKKDKETEEMYNRAEEVLKNIKNRKKELTERLKFIQEKHFEGVYSDEDYLEFKKEIDEELEKLKMLEKNNGVEEVSATEEEIDVTPVIGNIKSIIQVYNNLESTEEKNKLLRKIFDHIKLDVLEKGTKNKKAKILLEPVLMYRILKPKTAGIVKRSE